MFCRLSSTFLRSNYSHGKNPLEKTPGIMQVNSRRFESSSSPLAFYSAIAVFKQRFLSSKGTGKWFLFPLNMIATSTNMLFRVVTQLDIKTREESFLETNLAKSVYLCQKRM